MVGAGTQRVAELLCRTDEFFLSQALFRTAPLDLDARPAATIPKGSHIVGRHAQAHCDLLAGVDNPTPMAGCTISVTRAGATEGGAGCVNAHVRICAGGPGRPGSLPCSKGLPYPVWIIEATGNGRTSMNQTKSPLRRCLDRKSRVNREVHARFCERLGVKFPRATRLPAQLVVVRKRHCLSRFAGFDGQICGGW